MYTCKICGKHFEKEYYGKGICSVECFKEDFWNDTLSDNPVIINGRCYTIGDENSKDQFRGFGGIPYHIRFKDGREVKTTNLWYRGDVPKNRYIGDNAIFMGK